MSVRPLRLTQPASAPLEANRRRYGRLRVAEVYCSLGEVLDVAPEGLKIRARGLRTVRIGQGVSMTLGTPLGLMPVRAMVVWLRRVSLKHTEIGLALVNLTEDGRRAMTAIAQGCGDSKSLPAGRSSKKGRCA